LTTGLKAANNAALSRYTLPYIPDFEALAAGSWVINNDKAPYFTVLEEEAGRYKIKVNLQPAGYTKYKGIKVEVIHTAISGWTLNIGDSISNDGYGGDAGDQAYDSELQILDGTLSLYANDYGGSGLLESRAQFAQAGKKSTIEITNHQIRFTGADNSSGTVNKPYLFALYGQGDAEGTANYDLFIGVNRTIGNADRNGFSANIRVWLYLPVFEPAPTLQPPPGTYINKPVNIAGIGDQDVLTFSGTKILASDGVSGDYFGYTMAAFGNTLIVGSPGADLDLNVWGAVYVYQFSGSNWTFQQRLFPADGQAYNYFGSAFAISGNRIIASLNNGAAYIFAFNGTSWIEQQKLINTDPLQYEHFGYSVAIDGNNALVGVVRYQSTSSNYGCAYLYTYNGTSWVQLQRFTSRDVAENDFYGYAVSIRDNRLFVGAPYNACYAQNSSAGKSSLLYKLFNREYSVPDNKQLATTGIVVKENWACGAEKDCRAHIWDFGGQQIQYMLHQFFLTESCLYILMAEKRRELTKFDYWFNILHVLGKRSPVIVLFNEINIDGINGFLFDEKKYNGLFPRIAFTRLDINLANMTDGRFDVLVNTIKAAIPQLPHIGQTIPAKWKTIREELDKRRGGKLLPVGDFYKLCADHTITELTDQRLKDTLFLDPNWTVNAIYTILGDKAVEKYNGTIPYSFITQLWDTKQYNDTEQVKLMSLMLKDAFELCYPCRTQKDHYIIPMLLPEAEPAYTWLDDGNLFFRFQYSFMPRGITNRLMVRLNEMIDNNVVWQKGVIFAQGGARALVIEKETTKEGLKIIEIALNGQPDKRKEILTLIRNEIKAIQSSSFPNLPYAEMVPCNCRLCASSHTPEYYEYEGTLLNLLKIAQSQKQKAVKQCNRSGEMVDILGLIDAVYNIKTDAANRQQIIIEGDCYMGDHYEQVQGIMGKKVHAHHNTFNQTNYNAENINIDHITLESELKRLIEALRKEAATPEQFQALAETAQAEQANKDKDKPKLLAHLKKGGQWVLDTAVKIGVPVATEVLKRVSSTATAV